MNGLDTWWVLISHGWKLFFFCDKNLKKREKDNNMRKRSSNIFIKFKL